MKKFKPTYLYIKTHNGTGLMYLGKTVTKNPNNYVGSGTIWIRHVKKHGKNISTFIIGLYDDEEECRRVALFYSWFFDVVKSKDWANLKEENGLDGGGPGRTPGYTQSKETREKIRYQVIQRIESGTFINYLATREDGTSVTGDRTAAGLNPNSKRPDGTSLASDRVVAGLCSFQVRQDGTSVTSDRVVNGTHPNIKREDGTSWMEDRTALGLNPLSKREDGTSSTGDRTALGLNPLQSHNQIKKECPICHGWFYLGNYINHHGENCGKEKSQEIREKMSSSAKNVPKKECEYCGKSVNPSSFIQFHGDRCKMNPNSEIIQKECPHCHKLMDAMNYARYHGDRCKMK